MSAADDAVVRRFYEEMNNGRKNELAPELFTADHKFHDPQVPAADGPQGVADAVSVYQTGVDGHWEIEDIFSAGDRVAVRWIGSGTHVGEVNGIPPTGTEVAFDVIDIVRIADRQIREHWNVVDAMTLMSQLGAA